MSPPAPSAAGPAPHAGRSASLVAGLAAGALAGLLLGAADAWHAWDYFRGLPPQAWTETSPVRAVDLALGTAGGALLYGPAAAVLGALLGALAHPLLARRSPSARRAWLFVPLFTAAAGAALFWWTREIYHPGKPVQSPERLLVIATCAGIGLACGALIALGLARLPRGAWRALALLHVATWLVGAGYVFAEGRAAAARGALSERNQDLPNVLFVLVDALRPDVLGCYGNRTVKTPHVDALARRGVVFERALVQAPYTWTSFGSWFTGKYPRRHGLVKMGPGQRLEANVTLQAHLKGATRRDGARLLPEDYSGAAFMTGALSHGSGLMDGFDGYVELMKGHPFVELDSRWSQLRSVFVGPGALFKLRAKLDPDFLANEARRWLAEHAGRRFAAFVHLYSTHTPYDPPEPWRSLYQSSAYDGPIRRFDADIRRVIEQGHYQPTDADRRQIVDLYLGGVSQADHHLGLLVGELERQGVLDDTLVILTSDHGEDLGEGGRWEHNHMYDSNLHVPLVLSWPGRLPAGARVAATVESIDLFPTVADLLGLELPPVAVERDRIDGTSLLPLVRGDVTRVREHFFAEDSTYVAVQDERSMLVLERFAVLPDGWRIALEEQVGRIRLHDLEADPKQQRELFQELVFGEPEEGASPEARERFLERRAKVLSEVERLRAALLAWNATMPIHVESVVRSARDEETERALAVQRDAELARLRGEGIVDDAELARRMATLGYTEGFDDYQGTLRERVLDARERSPK